MMDGGRRRDSSSRSPAMVSTRKASHQGTASYTGRPVAHSMQPWTQATAPSTSVKVNRRAGARRHGGVAASSTSAAAT